jgi:hypothetical protein
MALTLARHCPAAAVSWSSPSLLDSAGQDFSNTGVIDAIYFGALNTGPSSYTVNGITFKSATITGDSTITIGAGAIGGATQLNTYRDDGTPQSYATYPLVEYATVVTDADEDVETIVLKNLTVGRPYEIQALFSAGTSIALHDSSGMGEDTGPRETNLASYDDAGDFATVTSTSPTIKYDVVSGSNDADFYGAQVETGVFTADATTEYLATPLGIGMGNRTSLAAVSLSSPVPEPASFSVVGLSAAFALARRPRGSHWRCRFTAAPARCPLLTRKVQRCQASNPS